MVIPVCNGSCNLASEKPPHCDSCCFASRSRTRRTHLQLWQRQLLPHLPSQLMNLLRKPAEHVARQIQKPIHLHPRLLHPTYT